MSEPERQVAQPRWVHWCDPPMALASNARGWVPAHPPGEVWYCGCGQAYGATSDAWGQGDAWTQLTPGTPVANEGPRE